MTNAKRGRGLRRGVYFCAIATLGLALSACGGGASGSSAAASAVQSSQPAQSSMPAQSTSAQTSTPAQSTPTGSTTTPTGSTTTSTAPGTASSTPPTASTGTVTINWQPPTENTDGTALTNLAGYNIHYGVKSGNYTQTISVSNPGLATYVVSNLTPGTYYFTVAAVNSSGTESPLSSEVTTTVN